MLVQGQSQPPRSKKAVLRACDQCHRRRVKCDGAKDCGRCKRNQSTCTYDNPVRPKGPAPRSRVNQDEHTGSRPSDEEGGSSQRDPSLVPNAAPRTGLSNVLLPSSSAFGTQQQQQQVPLGLSAHDLWPTPTDHGAGPSRQPHQEDAGTPIFDHMDNDTRPFRNDISQEWLDDAWFSQLGPDQMLDQQHDNTLAMTPGTNRLVLQGGHRQNSTLIQGYHPSMDLHKTFTLDPKQVACAPIIDTRWQMDGVVPSPQNQFPGAHSNETMTANTNGRAIPTNIALDQQYNRQTFEQPPAVPPVTTIAAPSFLSHRDPSVSSTFGPSPIVRLAIDSLILPQAAIFYKRIFPMIPVLSPAYIYEKIAIRAHYTDPEFCAMLLALTALTLIHPLAPEERAGKDGRRDHAKMLLAEACRLRDSWDFGSRDQFEAAMTSYFMFGALFELGQVAAARIRLSEALALGEIMSLHRKDAYDLGDVLDAQRKLRLFWVLTVTERAYALQRGGNIVFTGKIYESIEEVHPHMTAMLAPSSSSTLGVHREALQHLVRIFSYIDGDIVLCWNGQCEANCQRLTLAKVCRILGGLAGDTQDVFGVSEQAIDDALSESQKVDLFITWQWLRNRIWRLAYIHGLVDIHSTVSEHLSVAVPFQVARMACMWCEVFSKDAMDQHGRGFVEKLCDLIDPLPKLMQPDVIDLIRSGLGGDIPDIFRLLKRMCFHISHHCRYDGSRVAPILSELQERKQLYNLA